jgi:hypothetical protein
MTTTAKATAEPSPVPAAAKVQAPSKSQFLQTGRIGKSKDPKSAPRSLRSSEADQLANTVFSWTNSQRLEWADAQLGKRGLNANNTQQQSPPVAANR